MISAPNPEAAAQGPEECRRMTDGFGLVDMRSYVDDAARIAPDVSRWSIGTHVHHCCLAMSGICKALINSTPPPPRR